MKHAFTAVHGDPASARAGEASLSILLVDGKAASRLPLAKKLAEAGGYAVYSASSGAEVAGRAVLADRDEA